MLQQRAICPSIFKENTADDYLKAAVETAGGIDTLCGQNRARAHLESPLRRVGRLGFRRAAFYTQCLYDGAAGIGIFLLRLFEATGEECWVDEAKDARGIHWSEQEDVTVDGGQQDCHAAL